MTSTTSKPQPIEIRASNVGSRGLIRDNTDNEQFVRQIQSLTPEQLVARVKTVKDEQPGTFQTIHATILGNAAMGLGLTTTQIGTLRTYLLVNDSPEAWTKATEEAVESEAQREAA